MITVESWDSRTLTKIDFENLQTSGLCPTCRRRKDVIPGLDAYGCGKCKTWFSPRIFKETKTQKAQTQPQQVVTGASATLI